MSDFSRYFSKYEKLLPGNGKGKQPVQLPQHKPKPVLGDVTRRATLPPQQSGRKVNSGQALTSLSTSVPASASKELVKDAKDIIIAIEKMHMRSQEFFDTFFSKTQLYFPELNDEQRKEEERMWALAEIDCRDGQYCDFLCTKLPYTRITGLSNNKEHLRLARQRRAKSKVKMGRRIWNHDFDNEEWELNEDGLRYIYLDVEDPATFDGVEDDGLPLIEVPYTPDMEFSAPDAILEVFHAVSMIICRRRVQAYPLPVFFTTVKTLMGYATSFLLVSSIHPDLMKLISPDEQVHSIESIVCEGRKQGFKVGPVWQHNIVERDVEGFHADNKRLIGVPGWFVLTLILPRRNT